MKYLILVLSISLFFFSSEGISQTKRTQEPTEPYNYISEDVYFTNPKADNIKLAGTLTLPKGVKNPPAVILISGSGPQNRNGEVKMFNLRPFLVLSDYLTNQGIAVLRFDERGIEESEGDFSTVSSFDLASDVEAAIEYLKTRQEINPLKIGLIGHSEGGLISPIIASRNKNIAFIILLAGPGVNGQEVLQSQSWEMAKNAGATEDVLIFNKALTTKVYDAIKSETDADKIELGIRKSLAAFKEQLITEESPFASQINDALINQLAAYGNNNWFTTFIRINPQEYLEKVTCPVLAINGSKDLQVLPKLNLDAIESSLKKAKNEDVTIKLLDDLNHMFQKAETGSLQEYAQIEETINPTVLELISNWILKRFK